METVAVIWGHSQVVRDYKGRIKSFPSHPYTCPPFLIVMPLPPALLLGLNIFKGIKVQKTACLINNSP